MPAMTLSALLWNMRCRYVRVIGNSSKQRAMSAMSASPDQQRTERPMTDVDHLNATRRAAYVVALLKRA